MRSSNKRTAGLSPNSHNSPEPDTPPSEPAYPQSRQPSLTSSPSHLPTKPILGYGDYLRFRELVRERSGLHFPEKKWTDLEMGIFKALAESPMTPNHGGQNLDDYYTLLADKSSPVGRAEMDRLIKMLTIGETHFFRDKAQFDALAKNVLPELIERKRAAAAAIGPGTLPQLRIWSAGCATGEEPYSIAIVLKDLLPDLENWQILILATDINPDALARAREGLYSDWSFRENRAKALRPHYFRPETSRRYRLQPKIRQMVTFASLNLVEDDFPAIYNNTMSMDLILCRNVTIYFAEEGTRQVIKKFYDTLAEGGWLVVGHSEPSLLIYQAFQLRPFPDTFLYQKVNHPPAYLGNSAWFDNTETIKWPVQPAFSVTAQHPEVLPVESRSSARSNQVESLATFDPLEHAEALLQAGRVQDAVVALQQKLSLEPDFASAHSLLALAYADLGRWEEARQWGQSALKLDSLLAEAYFVLGLVAQNEADTQTAIGMFKKAIYLKRFEPLFHFHLATLYHQQNQAELTRRAYQNVIKILEKWPPDQIVPYSGGATAKYLLDTMQRIWVE